MIQQELDKANKKMLKDLTKITKVVMSRNGVSRNSDVIKSVQWERKENSFVMLANDYYEYLSTGRKPNARKISIDDLIPWMKKVGIKPSGNQTINSLAFAIQTSIYKSGISGKHFADPVVELTLDEVAEGTLEALAEIITTALADSITNI